MAPNRKICEEEIEGEMEDRLSCLPHDLKIRILSSLDTKHAIQTSMLLKRWVSLWTWIPVLDFGTSSASFNRNVDAFDKFVYRVLCLRDQSAKLDRLTFARPEYYSFANILDNVFDYAFSHGVKQLEADVFYSCNGSWPVCLNASLESLTSLKLHSQCRMSCPFLGPRSESFKNLTVLYLKGAIITDLDPFSGFPVLESLTLNCCFIETDGETLSVHARNLSDLTIWSYQDFKCCELTTPRLRFFRFDGCQCDLPLFRTHKGLPVLDTMEFGLKNNCSNPTHHTYEKRIVFNNLVTLFCAIDNVKSLTLSPLTVGIMSLFREELVKRSLAFRNLKYLKLHSRSSYKIVADAKVYFLQNSPDAEVIMIDHPVYELF